MKTLKVSELTQEQHEEDVEIVLLSDVRRLRETNAALNMRLEAHEAAVSTLRVKAKGWVESLRGEGYDDFADEVEEAIR